MENILPSGFVMEYDCRMKLASEKATYNILSQADYKLEISFQKGEKLYHFETNFTNLIKY